MNDRITIDGLTFSVRLEPDYDSESPWAREDGHGPVSDWTTRDKRPGEWVLSCDRHHRRFYDAAEATRIAKRDAWGLNCAALAALEERIGRAPTRGEITAEAVRRDFQRLHAWCIDEWCYVGVVVELLNTDGEPTGENASLWGVESDADDFIDECAQELAQELAARFAGQDTIETVTRIRSADHD